MATPEPDANPFAAPQSVIVSGRTRAPRTDLRWHLAWAVVFGANLIVPLMFGWPMTRGAGRVGLVLGIALMLSLGHWLCSRYARVRFPLVAGGVCVGLSQCWPMLQIWAGIFASAITRTLLQQPFGADQDSPNYSTGLEGLLMTALTGGQLMLAAVMCGYVIFLLKFPMKNVTSRRRQ